MTDSATTMEIHPLIEDHFPDFPIGVTCEGVEDLIESAEKSIINYNGKYTVEIVTGILALRSARDELADKDCLDGSLLNLVDNIDFQLKDNLKDLQIGKNN